MRVAMLSPIAWRTPPRRYGPWEQVVSLLTEELVKRGVDVTLFATGDSITNARLQSVCLHAWEEDAAVQPKVWECLHIAQVFEQAAAFDLIHNHFDFLPLTYSRLVSTPMLTTIHGFSSPKILPVYRQYNRHVRYVSISNADRAPDLDYVATIYHGIDFSQFNFNGEPGDYLCFFGRFHPDKGPHDAIKIARRAGMPLRMAGLIQDANYYREQIEPLIDGVNVIYEGVAGPQERNLLLGGARALLHPIYFSEPFGLSVVESMACGTPVIAYARGSMPEIVVSGENGFLVESVDEAVEAVFRVDRIARPHCRELAKERFSVDRMTSDYLDVYDSILAT